MSHHEVNYHPPRPLLVGAIIVAIALLFALMNVDASGQDVPTLAGPQPVAAPLSVTVESVEIETVVETLERSSSAFEGVQVAPVEKILSETRSKTNAAKVTVEGVVNAVKVYTTEFYEVSAVELPAVGQFLIQAPPGRYLVIVDTPNGSRIRPIVIEGTEPPTPPVPDVPDVTALSEFAAELADALNDPPTRGDMASTLAALDFTGDTLATASAKVSRAIDGPNGVLSRRRGPSEDVFWLGWRRAIQKAIIDAGVTSAEGYVEAVRQVVKGLQAPATVAASATPPPRKIRVLAAPAWTAPASPYVGMVHNGRRYTQVCEGTTCYYVWKVIN